MEAQPRGRSPSRGQRQHISPVPSPHHYHDAISGLDPGVSEQTFTTGRFNTSQHFSTPYLDSTAPQPQQQSGAQDPGFYPDNEFNQAAFRQQQQFQGQSLDPSYANADFMYSGENMMNDFGHNYSLNTTFNPNQQANINPADLSKMSSPQDQPSPNLLSPETHSSPGQPGSPASTNGQFYTPQHSRHQSLDPSAAYGQPDWQGIAFQQHQHHRRAPSDQSDISSNANSPYLSQQLLHQSIEAGHSPYVGAQPDTSNSYGIEGFSLNEVPRSSPGHSPYISPRLLPSQTQQQGLGLGQEIGLEQPHMFPPQPESTYPNASQMHGRHASNVSDIGRADQFPIPELNIEPAPVSRQASFGPDAGDINNSLSPPNRTNRGRSKSDVTSSRGPLSRSVSPSGRHHGAVSENLSVSRSPSPSISRHSSPGPDSGRIEKNRRASTSSINSREYILDLADPGRPSPAHASTRIQKHPATFQCTLCPKRFTRAYNLRSHLRTHTDERPFVCTVCGKAFARQHDRKRHEGLHTGEKKFVCRGELHSSPGQHWGCGRRFARADALGRHFRSEAGRVCIKPLLDEEAADRRHRQVAEQQEQLQYAGGLQPIPQPMIYGADPTTGQGGFSLPAALLAQYPALQNIDWSQLANQPAGMDDEGELSDVGMGGSASFDGSSGGEYYDDGTDAGYVSGNGGNPGMGMGYGHAGEQHVYQ